MKYKILCAAYTVALILFLSGCGAEIKPAGPIPTVPQQQDHTNPSTLTGSINGQSWTMFNGEARNNQGMSGNLLQLNFWDSTTRVPCSTPSMTDIADTQVYLTVQPVVGQTTYNGSFPADGTSLMFSYTVGSMTNLSLATSGTANIDQITATTVVGHMSASAGAGFSGSGNFTVTLCQ